MLRAYLGAACPTSNGWDEVEGRRRREREREGARLAVHVVGVDSAWRSAGEAGGGRGGAANS